MKVFKGLGITAAMPESEIADLTNDFKAYKATNMPPDSFGRDALYDHPHTLPIVKAEGVSHIHLADPDNPWRINTPQYGKTSDYHLVYCQGALVEDHYLLIALLKPNAHDLATNNDVMYEIGATAARFRMKF